MRKKAIVIGSGAGGATVARQLQGTFDVTVLEAGGEFKPFSMNMNFFEKMRKTGLFLDEKMIQLLFPAMKIQKTRDRMILVRGIGHGGTTTLSAGNAIRKDEDLKKIGINLDEEFNEIYNEIPVTTDHFHLWRANTLKLFQICKEMNLDPHPLPKMGDYKRCKCCGKCILGCASSVKWDSRKYLEDAVKKGARIVDGCKVIRIKINDKLAKGVYARNKYRTLFYPADLIILAAGGAGTPVILHNSGIKCEERLFIDPVLCVAAESNESNQDREISMPFVVQRDHYILSPYFDWLSFYFNRKWKIRAKNLLGMQIKLADSNSGSVNGSVINKKLSDNDRKRLTGAVDLCTEILTRFGIKKDGIFFGTINAGHPGGMLPLTVYETGTFHNPVLPENLYVADSSLLPNSLGNPPILTIIAMAKRISKLCIEKYS
jgi:choline dehydrogenase-like flavoprotein